VSVNGSYKSHDPIGIGGGARFVLPNRRCGVDDRCLVSTISVPQKRAPAVRHFGMAFRGEGSSENEKGRVGGIIRGDHDRHRTTGDVSNIDARIDRSRKKKTGGNPGIQGGQSHKTANTTYFRTKQHVPRENGVCYSTNSGLTRRRQILVSGTHHLNRQPKAKSLLKTNSLLKSVAAKSLPASGRFGAHSSNPKRMLCNSCRGQPGLKKDGVRGSH